MVNERQDPLKGKNVIWKPQEGSQEAFLTCPLFEVLYEGTRGPGKTDSLLMDFAQHVGQGFGIDWKGILFRQTYKQLDDVISKSLRWYSQMFPGAKYNKVEHTWTFETGEKLLFRHMSDPNDYWNYHGHAFPWIGWEELTNWPDDRGFKRMMACCRSTNATMPRKYRSTCNPYGVGHNWVKTRYRLPGARGLPIVDSLDDDGKLEPARVAIHGHIYENKILLDGDPDYIDRIRASAENPAMLKAWLEGSWDVVAGGMFDDVWDHKVNCVLPFAVPSGWRIDRSFDWGSSKPFSVGWWAESDGSDYIDGKGVRRSSVRGDLFRIAEWYGWNGKPNQGKRLLATEIATGIVERELLSGYAGRIIPGPADSSIFDVENGNSIALDMLKTVKLNGKRYKGIAWERADKSAGSRKAGWQNMRRLMKHAKRNEIYGRDQPGIFVFTTCDQFLRTVPVLPRDEDDQDDVDTQAEDHIGDEARYRCHNPPRIVKRRHTKGSY